MMMMTMTMKMVTMMIASTDSAPNIHRKGMPVAHTEANCTCVDPVTKDNTK